MRQKRVSFDECEILILSIKKDNTESISAFYAAFDNAHQVLFDCCFQITALCGVRIAADLFLAVGIIYVYVVSFLGFGIPYIFHETTGHKRLGFGIARVVLALLHFNIFVFIYRGRGFHVKEVYKHNIFGYVAVVEHCEKYIRYIERAAYLTGLTCFKSITAMRYKLVKSNVKLYLDSIRSRNPRTAHGNNMTRETMSIILSVEASGR